MTYINKERPSSYGKDFKTMARKKADRYREIAVGFEIWCKDNDISENEMNSNLNALDGLIDFWEMRAEMGETEAKW